MFDAAKRFGKGREVRMILVTALLFVLAAGFVPRSLSQASLAATLPLAAVLALAGIGETLVMQQRGIDLSVPGTLALGAYLLADVPGRYGISEAVAIVAVCVVSIVIGLVNGLLIVKGGINSLVATLATGAALTGVLMSYSGGGNASVAGGVASFGSATIGGISLMLWLTLVLAVLVAIAISTTSLGRRFVATGAAPNAARISGLVPDRYEIGSYVAGALCYGLAGCLLVSYVGTSSTTLGNPYELSVIAVVIIGGTPLYGGKGSVVATWFASLLLAELDQIVLTLGAPSSSQLLIQSIIIAGAAALTIAHTGSRLRLSAIRGLWRRRTEQASGADAGN